MSIIMTARGWRQLQANCHNLITNDRGEIVGDEPGCTQGVFHAQTLEEVQRSLGPRISSFCHALANNEHMTWRYEGEILRGAFGEVL